MTKKPSAKPNMTFPTRDAAEAFAAKFWTRAGKGGYQTIQIMTDGARFAIIEEYPTTLARMNKAGWRRAA